MYKETPIGQIIHMRLQIACSSHDFRIFEKMMNFQTSFLRKYTDDEF